MIEIKIKKIDRDEENELVFKGSTKEKIFEDIYKYRRTYRYCSDIKFKFVDESNEKEYNDWWKNLDRNKSFSLYYGSGIVD